LAFQFALLKKFNLILSTYDLRNEKFANFKNVEAELMNQTRLQNLGKEESREAKQRQSDIEKSLEEQLAQTLVLQIDANLLMFKQQAQLADRRSSQTPLSSTSNVIPTATLTQQWNWLEVVKLFESYLLVESSVLESRFYPTNDALYLNTFTKVLSQNQKLYKCVEKLFDFFLLTPTG
jgi:hypothetical protein